MVSQTVPAISIHSLIVPKGCLSSIGILSNWLMIASLISAHFPANSTVGDSLLTFEENNCALGLFICSELNAEGSINRFSCDICIKSEILISPASIKPDSLSNFSNRELIEPMCLL